MSITQPDDRVTSYAPVVPTETFAADFPVFDNSDLVVIHNGVERLDFTVQATYVQSISNDARVTFSPGITGTVLVVGARKSRRSNRFGPGPINANMLNAAFDTAQGELQEVQRDTDRAMKVNYGETPPDISLLAQNVDEANAAAAAAIGAANGQFVFSNIAAFVSSSIPPIIGFVRTAGYTVAGDGGAALFSRLSDTPVPVQPWHKQSADGAWWQISGDYPNLKQFNASADGVTDDTVKIQSLESRYSSMVIDLQGKTYLVSAIPSGNMYVNGFWKVGSTVYDALTNGEILGSASDTGSIGAPYSGGILNYVQVAGRTNPKLFVLVGSQNCRSWLYPRTGNYSSINCDAAGNVSGNLFARQCGAYVPQSGNFCSEECWVWGGFRGINLVSFSSGCEGEANFNLGTRSSYSTGRDAGNIASSGAFAGRGGGCRLLPQSTAGVLTGITVALPGAGYQVSDSIVIFDGAGAGAGAVVTVASVNGTGGILSVAISNGGSGYSASQFLRASVDNGTGDFSLNAATTNGCETAGEASINAGCNAQKTPGLRAGSLGSQGGTNSGQNGVQAGSDTCLTAALRTGAYSSGGSQALNPGSILLGANNSINDQDGALLFGRRGKPGGPRCFTIVDAASGAALTANRRFEVSPNGNVTASGTFTGSTVYSDYAIVMPNADDKEIPVGTPVTIEKGKVREWSPGKKLRGVVSATAFIIENDTPHTWAKRFMTGPFGELLMEDVRMVRWPEVVVDTVTVREAYDGTCAELEALATQYGEDVYFEDDAVFFTEPHPKQNPDFDPKVENIPRSQRKTEFSIVGRMGLVWTRVPEGCEVGDFPFDDNLEVLTIGSAYDPKLGYAIAHCWI